MEKLITITQTKESLVKATFKIPYNQNFPLRSACVSLQGPFHGQRESKTETSQNSRFRPRSRDYLSRNIFDWRPVAFPLSFKPIFPYSFRLHS